MTVSCEKYNTWPYKLTGSVTGEKTINNKLIRDTNHNGFGIPIFIATIRFISFCIVN